MKFDVEVRVWLKPSVFDPQGNAVESALHGLGHEGVENVRIGKYMNLQIESPSQADAESKVKELCETVLCNLVIETYNFDLSPAANEGKEAKSDAGSQVEATKA